MSVPHCEFLEMSAFTFIEGLHPQVGMAKRGVYI